jgi:hypothetical protein
MCRTLKLGHSQSPFTSINSKWVKGLNVRLETVKLIQEKVGNTLNHIGMGNNFMKRIQIAQQSRQSFDK